MPLQVDPPVRPQLRRQMEWGVSGERGARSFPFGMRNKGSGAGVMGPRFHPIHHPQHTRDKNVCCPGCAISTVDVDVMKRHPSKQTITYLVELQ